MVCLVVEQSAEAREGLCLLLLEFGILGLPARDRAEAESVLKARRDIQTAIVDVDNRGVDAPWLLAEMRRRGIRCLAHSVNAQASPQLQPFTEGVLLKPFDDARTAQALKTGLLRDVFDPLEKRQHMRVAPRTDELLRASFRIAASTRLYTGRVRNISAGGAAIEIYKGPADSAIQVGWRILRLEFTLGTTPLSPEAVIVLYRRRLLAVRFEAMDRRARAALARYVYDRLTAT